MNGNMTLCGYNNIATLPADYVRQDNDKVVYNEAKEKQTTISISFKMRLVHDYPDTH